MDAFLFLLWKFSTENRVSFLNRPRSISPFSLLSHCLVARRAWSWAADNVIVFDDPKTELMHFHNKTSSNTRNSPVTLPHGTIIHPLQHLRWLGVWLDRKLLFNYHVQQKTAAATRALSQQ